MHDYEALRVTKLGQTLDPSVGRGEQVEVEATVHTTSLADHLGNRSGWARSGSDYR
jgi:hypothetical protein